MRKFLLLLALAACTSGPAPEDDPEPPEPTPRDYPELTALDAVIEAELETSNVSGLSACITRGEDTLWCEGYGLADREENRPVTPRTPFMLASVSKTVTGVALMHLVETGELTLDDPVGDHLDFEVVHPTDPTAITARMLMTHTAGIADNWGAMGAVIVDGDSPIALGDFLADYLVPGGEWYSASDNFVQDGVLSARQYSNIGAALAGYLVEAVSGVPFSSYCETHIFEPLGLTDTGWHLADLDEDLLAVPYDWSGEDWEPIEHYGYPDYPDGALRTGAEQLASFMTMFANEGSRDGTRVLSQDSVAEMRTVHYPDLDSNQGLIWYSWALDGESVTGHNGADAGVSTEIGFRDDGTGFVVLMNGRSRDGILGNVERALFEAADSL